MNLLESARTKPEHGRLLLMRYGVENRKSNAIIRKSTSEDELTDNIRKAIDFVFYCLRGGYLNALFSYFPALIFIVDYLSSRISNVMFIILYLSLIQCLRRSI